MAPPTSTPDRLRASLAQVARTAPVTTAGRYRVQMSIGAVGEAKQAVPAAFMVVESSGREDAVVREMRLRRNGPHARVVVIAASTTVGLHRESLGSVRFAFAVAPHHPLAQAPGWLLRRLSEGPDRGGRTRKEST